MSVNLQPLNLDRLQSLFEMAEARGNDVLCLAILAERKRRYDELRKRAHEFHAMHNIPKGAMTFRNSINDPPT